MARPKRKKTNKEIIQEKLPSIITKVEYALFDNKGIQVRDCLEFESYKKFCDFLDIPCLNSSSKNAELNLLQKYIKFEIIKVNQRYCPDIYKIKGIYPSKIPLQNFINKQFKVSDKYKHSQGVYKVYNDKYIYIGSSIDLYKRYSQHKHGHVLKHLKNNTQDTTTYSILNNTNNFGYPTGFFECIEIVDGTEEQLREKEIEYIKNYNGNLSLLNSKLYETQLNTTTCIPEDKAVFSIICDIQDYQNIIDFLNQSKYDFEIQFNKQTQFYKNYIKKEEKVNE